jgi:hypothetical protein
LIPGPKPGTLSERGVNAGSIAIASSLFLLGLLLAILSVRGILKFLQGRVRPQLMWGSGLALAAAAMVIEGVVYVGVVDSSLLQAYVFLSAAIVGVLSLGATRILKSPRLESIYTGYTVITCGVVALFSAVTPLPTSMVTGGIIAGNPPASLIILSSFVTFPATVLLLGASYLSLRRSWRWQTILMAAGAITLGAGGTLYIASVPVALYYAEFLGILMLFAGLVSLPQPTTATAGAHATAT